MDQFNKDDIESAIENLQNEMNDVPFTPDELVQKLIIVSQNNEKLRKSILGQNETIHELSAHVKDLYDKNTELLKIIQSMRNGRSVKGNEDETIPDSIVDAHVEIITQLTFYKMIAIGSGILGLLGIIF